MFNLYEKENINYYLEAKCILSISKEDFIKNYCKSDHELRTETYELYDYDFINQWIGTQQDKNSNAFFTKYSYLGEEFINEVKHFFKNNDNDLLFDLECMLGYVLDLGGGVPICLNENGEKYI